MTAKIKTRPSYNSERHKPRGVSKHSFRQVYWPYLPLLLVGASLLVLNFRAGSLHPANASSTVKTAAASTTSSTNAYLLYTNGQRSAAGDQPLSLSGPLSAAAQAKAADMAARDYWSHDTPEGNAPWIFATAQGYDYQKLGENLAAGFSGPKDVIKAWMTSDSHRANVLDPAYTDAGFGVAYSPNFTAAGKGPMFIVVAYFGRPVGAPANFSPSSNNQSGPDTSLTANTENLQLNSVSTSKTSRAQLALASLPENGWVTLAAIGVLLLAAVAWIGKHLRAVRRSIKKGQRYAFKHPLADLGFLAIIILCWLLINTAGVIR